LSAPCQLLVLAGPEHGRTIPLADLMGTRPSQAICMNLLFDPDCLG
jgi:hypothetical protein